MSKKIEEKPYIGEDGRLYFNFSVGAEYELKPPIGKPFTYTILSCEYRDGKELYRIAVDGYEKKQSYDFATLNGLLHNLPCTQTSEGERQELPLLTDEIVLFYSELKKERNKLNKAENEKLKGTCYNSCITLIPQLKRTMQLALSRGDDKAASEAKAKIEKLEEDKKKVLAEKEVDVNLLIKKPFCAKCNDSGLIDGEPCQCALEAYEEIKRFAALKRLQPE